MRQGSNEGVRASLGGRLRRRAQPTLQENSDISTNFALFLLHPFLPWEDAPISFQLHIDQLISCFFSFNLGITCKTKERTLASIKVVLWLVMDVNISVTFFKVYT